MNVCVPLLVALALVAVTSGSSDIEPLYSDAASAGSRLTRAEPDTDSKLTRDEPVTDSKLTREADQARAAAEQSNTYGNSAFGSGESGDYGNNDYKPSSYGESSGYGNNDYKPSGYGESSGYGNNDYKPSGHGESGGYGNNDYKPSGHGESGGYGNNDYKPSSYGESGGYGNNEYKPSGHGESSGYGNNEYKPSGYGVNQRESSDYGNADRYKPNGYGNDEKETSGRHGNGGYGHASAHGKGAIHRPTHFKSYIVHLPTTDGPPNELDQLFTRVEAVRDQVKTAEEETRALAARQAVQMMFLDQLVAIVLNELENTAKSEDDALDRLAGFLAALENEIDTEISNRVTEVKTRNQNNTAAREGLQSLLVDLEAADSIQSGVIRDLFSTASDFRGRLGQISRNEFELFEDTVENAEARLKYARATDSRGRCESGRLTLDAEERVVNYQYQTPFPSVPQVIAGLCGFNFDLDVIQDPEHFIQALYAFQSGYGGAGYGYEPPAEPDTVGVRVSSFSTPTGLHVEGFDLSLGDTQAVDVKVCFMACSVGPGTGPVVH